MIQPKIQISDTRELFTNTLFNTKITKFENSTELAQN